MSLWSEQMPVLVVVLPLLAAFLVPMAARSSRVLSAALGPLLLVALLAGSLELFASVLADGPRVLAMGGFPAPLGIHLVADTLGLLFVIGTLALALLLWPREPRDAPREHALTLLLVGSANGIALSGDLFNIFVFYEILSVASYGLAAGRATGAAYAASLRYLVLGATGSALALLGIALVYAATGSLSLQHIAGMSTTGLEGTLGLAAFALMVLGFGVKAELFPVNTWVPEVYGAATPRVSGLLAGAVSKLALLAVVKVLWTVVPGGDAWTLLLVVGLVTLVGGELAALRSNDTIRILSYSSIGQLGFAAVAYAAPGPEGLIAGTAVALHHLLVKPALFLLVAGWPRSLDALVATGRAHPLQGAVFVLLALSLIGVPPLPGFWAKYLLLKAVLATGDPLYLLAVVVVLAATVIEAAYLFRMAGRLFGGSELPARARAAAGDLVSASALVAVVVVVTLAVVPAGGGLERAATTLGVGQVPAPPLAMGLPATATGVAP